MVILRDRLQLNFLTRHKFVFTIPKATHPARAKENSGGAGWRLAEDEKYNIDKEFPAPDHDVPLGMI